MAVVTPPYVLQGGSHPAATFRQIQQGVMGSPNGTFAGGILPTTGGGGHGVASPADLLVTQNGAPNMSVNVASGIAFIRGTESVTQGVYGGFNDATVNLAISASDPTNPRIDLIVLKVRDTFYSGASNDLSLAVVTGTPAGVPVTPTVPANALVLAQIAVGALVGSIVTANITDKRNRAAALGGLLCCTSTTRPTGIACYVGQFILETDTKLIAFSPDGATWTYIGPATDLQVFTVNGTWTKPNGVNTSSVTSGVLIAPGGSGASGSRGTAAAAFAGGSAGGAGERTLFSFATSLLTATVAVTIGTVGAAGPAIGVDNTPGTTATASTATTFGAFATARPGGPGVGANAPQNGGVSGNGAGALAGAGGNSQVGSPGSTGGAGSSTVAGGGGGGAGMNAGATSTGGPGGASSGAAGGTAGAVGTAGGAGGASTASTGLPGGGGGGGGSANGAVGGAGGVGGIYGGGGGGGGASVNGFATGAGGLGGVGIAIIVTTR